MKRFYSLLLWLVCASCLYAATPQLRVELGDVSGYQDIYVTTYAPSAFPELGWADTSLPMSVPHRPMMLPLRLVNPHPTESYVGPTQAEAPDLYTNFLFWPMVRDTWGLELLDDDGETIRSSIISAWMDWGWFGDFDNDRIGIGPGQYAHTVSRMAWFDIAGVPNGEYWLFVEFDPLHKLGTYANLFLRVKIERYQVRVLR